MDSFTESTRSGVTPSANSIPQNVQNVNNKKSLSFKDSEISAKHSGYNVYGEDVKLEGVSDDTAEGAANDSSANLDQENFAGGI